MEQYTIRVEARFEAAHNLTLYKGAPEPLHGHSWKVEAKFLTGELNHEEIGIDIVDAEQALRSLAKRLDHVYINDVPPFDKISPTAENIARWFYQELNRPEIKQNTHLEEVVVWEGPEAFVAYSEKK